MKNITRIFSVIALGATLLLASCAKDSGMGPSPVIDGAFIHSEMGATTVSVSGENPSFIIPVMRSNKAGSLTVSLEYESEKKDLLSGLIPAVTFADGQERVNITITVDVANMEFNDPFTLTVTLNNDNTPYGLNIATFDVLKSLLWGETKVAKYTASAFGNMYSMPAPYSWYVKYQKAEGLEYYRLIRPYGPEEEAPFGGYTIGNADILEEELLDGDPSMYDIIINATDPNAVTIPRTPLGFAWGEGAVTLGAAGTVFNAPLGMMTGKVITIINYINLANYNPENNYAWSSVIDVIELDVIAPVIAPAPEDDSDDERTWNAAGQGYFSSNFLGSLPEEEEVDLVSGIVRIERANGGEAVAQSFRISKPYTTLHPESAYEGLYNLDFTYDVTTGTPLAVADQPLGIYLNLDAATLLPAYIENATIEMDGKYTFLIEGDFYLYDEKTETKHPLGTFTEEFFWNQLPDIGYTWESVGTGTFVDGLFPSAFLDPDEDEYVAAEWTWEVEVEQAKERPALYRIVNPYDKMVEEEYALALYDEYFIHIDTTDGEVYIPEQGSGVDVGGAGELGLVSAAAIADLSLGTFEDGVIDFGPMAFFLGANAYLMGYPMHLTLPDAEPANAPQAHVATHKPFDAKKVERAIEIFNNVIDKSAPAESAPVQAKSTVNKKISIGGNAASIQ